MIPEDERMRQVRRIVTLERGLILGVTATVAGGGLIAAAVDQWWATGFGPLDYATTMRWVIPGVTLAALGCQTILSSFFLSILRMASDR
jgi:hypothetical protein